MLVFPGVRWLDDLDARQQGFRFSAGLRPGVDVLAVFTSPAYSAAVIFLVVYAVFFVH